MGAPVTYNTEELFGQTPQTFSTEELFGQQDLFSTEELGIDVPGALSFERLGLGFARGVLQNILFTAHALTKGPSQGAIEFSVETANMLSSATSGAEYVPITEQGKVVKAVEDELGVPAETTGQKVSNVLSELAPDILGGIAAGIGRKTLKKLPSMATEATELFGEGVLKPHKLGEIVDDLPVISRVQGSLDARPEILKPIDNIVANEQINETSKLIDDVISAKPKAEQEQILAAQRTLEEKLQNAQDVADMFDRTDQHLKEMRAFSAKKLYEKLKRATVDVSGNLKKKLIKDGGIAGDEAMYRHDLARGATEKATRITNKAYDEIYGGLSASDEALLNRAISSRRNVVISDPAYKPGIVHQENIPGYKFEDFLETIEPEKSALLGERMNKYFTFMRNQVDELHAEGIITDAQHAGLIKHDYSPRWYTQYIDPEKEYFFGGTNKINVRDSGIKALKEGSAEHLETNSRLFIADVVNRNQAKIFRNKANKSLLELADSVPENNIVRRFDGDKVPGGYERISAMVDGKREDMLMPNDLAKEWILSDPEIKSTTANIVGWLSGSKILKPMATGINPEFALANLPRDIAHAWLTTQEYSRHLPLAAGQMVRDFAVTAKDVFTRKGRFLNYIDEGGGMGFLTHQGRITKPGSKNLLGRMQEYLGYLGETSELWTRLALRERGLRNGMNSERATWVARNYLDFSQGGSFIKAVDTAVPYLNASIQGTRGLFRSASQKPGQFMWKFSQLGGVAAGLYMYNRTNPKAWRNISRKDKANNWIITLPEKLYSYKDENGETRYRYLRIPKDQGQRLVTSLFENLMANHMRDEVDVDQVIDAAQDMIPLLPTEFVPPSMDALLGYATNTDFWRRDDIWKGQEVSPREEWTAYTPKAYVKLGEATGLSPKRTQHMVEQLFTSGNIYTTIGGMAIDGMAGTLDDSELEAVKKDIAKAPFIRRYTRTTLPGAVAREQTEKVNIEANTRRYKQNRQLDMLTNAYVKDKTDIKPLKDYIKEQPKEDQKRLLNRAKRTVKYAEAPNRSWWVNLSFMTPVARAAVFYAEYARSNEQDRLELMKWAGLLPGIASDAFKRKFKEMQQRDN